MANSGKQHGIAIEKKKEEPQRVSKIINVCSINSSRSTPDRAAALNIRHNLPRDTSILNSRAYVSISSGVSPIWVHR